MGKLKLLTVLIICKMLKAPRQWVACPLGFNVLLSMLKENTPTVDKYLQIAKTLENTQGCKLKNRVFVSSSKQKSNLGKFADIEKADFSKKENGFTVYINKYGDLRNHEFSNKTELIYTNICTFELMELPLYSEDFKLVLVLPNENDVIVKSLFATLTNQGLAAAVNSVQPLFTSDTALSTPMSIDVKSRVQIKEKINAMSSGSAVQYGSITVSDEGTRVKVLTCLYLPADTIVNDVEDVTLKPGTPPLSSPPFYFAVVYQDTPIFYGDFKRRLGA